MSSAFRILARAAAVLLSGYFGVVDAAPQLGIDELTNRGATRNIALAGATAAYPNNHSAFIENPASIPFQPSLVNLTFANASVVDKRIHSVSSDISIDKRSEFEGGVALRLFDILGLGGGIVTESFQLDRPYATNTHLGVDVSHTTFPISVAAHIFNELSLGISYNIHMAEIAQLGSDTNDASHLTNQGTSKYAGSSYKVSALYVANANLALAFTHQLDSTLTSSESGVPALHKPSRTQVAAVYFIPPFGTESGPFTENTVSAQLDIVNFEHDDTVYHPAAYMWQQSDGSAAIDESSVPESAKVIRGARYIPKFGVETLMFRSGDLEGQMWLGSYWEPALYTDDDSRAHMTGGLEVSAWFVVLRYALDIANSYKNQSLGIGVGLQF